MFRKRRATQAVPAINGHGRAKSPQRAFIEALESRRLLSGGAVEPAVQISNQSSGGQAPQGFTPDQIRHAYGFDQVTFGNGVQGDGSGQTIAIVDAFDDKTIAADLRTFDRQFGIPDPPSFVKLNQAGGTSLPDTRALWAAEIALDVEWAHAIAPAANIALVEANSATVADLATAVDTARHLSGVSVVSMSWGTDEFAREKAYDSLFTTPPGHDGVTFVAASGDVASGADAQWPAVSPNVLAVGGTDLSIQDLTGTYGGETAAVTAISGVSQLESESGAQQSVQQTGARTTPDVSYNVAAYAVYNSAAGGWQLAGGTSAGAPQWAALIAIANQGRAMQGFGPADGVSVTLPAIYDAAGSGFNVAYMSAETGSVTGVFSFQNGLGSPQAAQLVTAIADAPPVVADSPPPPEAAPEPDPTPPTRATARRKQIDVTPALWVYAATRVSIPPPPAANPFPSPPSCRPQQALNLPASIPVHPLAAPATGDMTAQSSHRYVFSHPWSTTAAIGWRQLQFAQSFAQAAADLVARWKAGSSFAVTSQVRQAESALMPLASIQEIYRFAHVNVAATFSDALGAFINESAGIAPGGVVPSHAPTAHTRAWAITAAVLVADLILIRHTLYSRERKRSPRVRQRPDSPPLALAPQPQ